MAKRPITPAYIVFYVLFLPDTWQILTGILVSWLIAPKIMPQGYGLGAKLLMCFMLAVIGYAASRPLGKWVSEGLKKMILGDKYKGF